MTDPAQGVSDPATQLLSLEQLTIAFGAVRPVDGIEVTVVA